MPLASTAKPIGVLKVAWVPTPSETGVVLPLPASVLTLHRQGGSALSPAVAHLLGTMQPMAGAGLPPGQKYPGAHSVALALTEPAAQPKPGGAAQAPLQVELVSPTAAPKNPAGHGEGTEEPGGQ